MKSAFIVFKELNDEMVKRVKWTPYSLGIITRGSLKPLQIQRAKGLSLYELSQQEDNCLEHKVQSKDNDGVLLYWSDVPNMVIDGLAKRLHRRGKKLIVNTEGGFNPRIDYGNADILVFDGFLHDFYLTPDSDCQLYGNTDPELDMRKMLNLKNQGYSVIAVSYGQLSDVFQTNHCVYSAMAHGADWFIYTEKPAYHSQDICEINKPPRLLSFDGASRRSKQKFLLSEKQLDSIMKKARDTIPKQLPAEPASGNYATSIKQDTHSENSSLK